MSEYHFATVKIVVASGVDKNFENNFEKKKSLKKKFCFRLPFRKIFLGGS